MPHPHHVNFILQSLTILLLILVHQSNCLRHDIHRHHPRLQSPSVPYGFPRTLHLHSAPDFQPLHPSLPHLVRLHTVELYGGIVKVGEYYAKIHIGGQMLRAQIDTGSATLAVPMGECVRCRRGDRRYWVKKSNSTIAKRISCDDKRCMSGTCFFGGCGKCSSKRACCSKQSPDSCGFHLRFGDDSEANGCLVLDEMSWGGVSFPVEFGGILKDSPDFERKQVDGILGLAYPSLACNPSCVTPPLEAMSKHLKMKNLFQMCIAEEKGMLVLGEEDASLTVEKPKWVPLHLASPPSYYTINIADDITVGGRALKLTVLKRAIVDSGTTLIVLSKSAFGRLKRFLQKNYCHVHGLCGSGSWFQPAHCAVLPDDQRRQLPTIVIPLENDVKLELGPDEYMINYASKGKDFWCVGLMSLSAMSGGIDVILGNTVMKKYVTTFDREKHRIGFAQSKGTCISRYAQKNNDALPRSNTAANEKEKPKKEEGLTEVDGGGSNLKSDSSLCTLAQNCRECARYKGCAWLSEERRCTKGKAVFLMCFRNPSKFLDNPFVAVGLFVGGSVMLLSIFVAFARRARASRSTDSDADERELLADDEDGIRNESLKQNDGLNQQNGLP